MNITSQLNHATQSRFSVLRMQTSIFQQQRNRTASKLRTSGDMFVRFGMSYDRQFSIRLEEAHRYLKRKDYEKALHGFTEALGLSDPDNINQVRAIYNGMIIACRALAKKLSDTPGSQSQNYLDEADRHDARLQALENDPKPKKIHFATWKKAFEAGETAYNKQAYRDAIVYLGNGILGHNQESPTELLKACNLLASAYRMEGETTNAQYWLREAEKQHGILQHKDDAAERIRTNDNWGWLYCTMGQLNDAEDAFMRNMDIMIQAGFTQEGYKPKGAIHPWLGATLRGLGYVERDRNMNPTSAIEQFEKALKAYRRYESHKPTSTLIVELQVELAKIHGEFNYHDEAESEYAPSREKFERYTEQALADSKTLLGNNPTAQTKKSLQKSLKALAELCDEKVAMPQATQIRSVLSQLTPPDEAG